MVRVQGAEVDEVLEAAEFGDHKDEDDDDADRSGGERRRPGNGASGRLRIPATHRPRIHAADVPRTVTRTSALLGAFPLIANSAGAGDERQDDPEAQDSAQPGQAREGVDVGDPGGQDAEGDRVAPVLCLGEEEREGEDEQRHDRLLERLLREVGGRQIRQRDQRPRRAFAGRRPRPSSADHATSAVSDGIASVSPAKTSIEVAPMPDASPATSACGPSG